MKYEKVTYTRTTWEISGGLLLTIVVIVALLANHKHNAQDAKDLAEWVAIVVGASCFISLAAMAALIRRARKRDKIDSNVIRLYPTYEADAVSPYPDMQAINPPTIIHNGEEYVRVITDEEYSRIQRNSLYGKGRHNG